MGWGLSRQHTERYTGAIRFCCKYQSAVLVLGFVVDAHSPGQLSQIVAMDAIFFGRNGTAVQQFSANRMSREVFKAFNGFSVSSLVLAREYPLIATGNWGCGAFGGEVGLKAMLQWIAASLAGRSIVYFSFDLPPAQIRALRELDVALRAQACTAHKLWTALVEYSRADAAGKSGQGLLNFLHAQFGIATVAEATAAVTQTVASVSAVTREASVTEDVELAVATPSVMDSFELAACMDVDSSTELSRTLSDTMSQGFEDL